MTNSSITPFRHSFQKSRGAIQRHLRTSSTRWKQLQKNQEKASLLEWLLQQLELGLEPKWLITWHLFTPEEFLKPLNETCTQHGFKDRYGYKYKGDLWKQSGNDKRIWKRRTDLDLVQEDTRQIRNVECKWFYGIKRHNHMKRFISSGQVPPMLYFHEMGKVKLQYHCHSIKTQLPKEFDDQATLEDFYNITIRNERKCFSRWKKVDVTKIYEPKGLIDYLVKETKSDKVSLDEHNSIVIKPPSKQGRNINSSYYSNNNQHDYFQKRLV